MVVQMDIGDAIPIIVNRLNGIVAPVDGMRHIETEATPLEAFHKSLPLIGAVHHMSCMGVEGDSNAERFAIRGEIIIDGGPSDPDRGLWFRCQVVLDLWS